MIDQSCFKLLCKILFKGILISEGKGRNKRESEINASMNALKVVAPNIYKDICDENSSKISENNIPNDQVHK